MAERADAAALATQPRRADHLEIDMCPSGAQLQRLMKISEAKNCREHVGTIRTNLVGMKARFPKGDGIHTIRLQAPELGLDRVFEVTSHSFDIPSGTCMIGIGSIANPYPWFAATEEKDLALNLSQIGTPAVTEPIPAGAVLIQEAFAISGDVQGVKLVLAVDDPGRDGLELRAQIARGDFAAVGPWAGAQPRWIEMAASSTIAESGVLDDGQVYTVRYRWRGYGDWRKLGPVTVVADPVLPPPPSNLGVMAAGSTAYIEWVNAPTRYYRTQVFMGSSTSFSSATLIATVAGSTGRADSYSHDVAGITGTRCFWVRTLNRSGIPSAPIGPISASF